jgi:hypothetical protein
MRVVTALTLSRDTRIQSNEGPQNAWIVAHRPVVLRAFHDTPLRDVLTEALRDIDWETHAVDYQLG